MLRLPSARVVAPLPRSPAHHARDPLRGRGDRRLGDAVPARRSGVAAPAAVRRRPEPPLDAAAAVCRPAVARPATEPWIDWTAQPQQLRGQANADAAGRALSCADGTDGRSTTTRSRRTSRRRSDGATSPSARSTAWHDYFAPSRSALAEQGIELTIQITPSVTSVYPQQLPEWTDGIVGSTPLDQFLAASPDLPIVDFRHDLRAASRDERRLHAGQQSLDRLGRLHRVADLRATATTRCTRTADAVWVPAVDGVESSGVFNEYAAYGVPDAEPAWTAPDLSRSHSAQVPLTASDGSTTTVTAGRRTVDLSKLPASTRDRRTPRLIRTALILRDSMGNALSPFWGQEYAQDVADPAPLRRLVEPAELPCARRPVPAGRRDRPARRAPPGQRAEAGTSGLLSWRGVSRSITSSDDRWRRPTPRASRRVDRGTRRTPG